MTFLLGVAATLGVLAIVCALALAAYLRWAWRLDPEGKFKR